MLEVLLKRLISGIAGLFILLVSAYTMLLALSWNGLIGIGIRHFGFFQELGLVTGSIALLVFAFRFFSFAFRGACRLIRS